MCRDVIAAAANYTNMVFPVFTNGTMIDDEYLAMFDRSRNLIPVLSIEGEEAGTDHLVLNESDQEYLTQTVNVRKEQQQDMILLSFPGDEEAMGGYPASGCGFFHINPCGGAEPLKLW